MLKAVVRSASLYHSPTIWPRRMTRSPVAPGAAALWSQAALSASQSTPPTSRICAFCESSGSPSAGSKVRQPPCSSGGGK